MASTPGFEPGPHFWETHTLNTVPSLTLQIYFVWINKFAFQKEECTRSFKLKFKVMFSLIIFY